MGYKLTLHSKYPSFWCCLPAALFGGISAGVVCNYTCFGKNCKAEFPAKGIRAHLIYFSLSLMSFLISHRALQTDATKRTCSASVGFRLAYVSLIVTYFPGNSKGKIQKTGNRIQKPILRIFIQNSFRDALRRGNRVFRPSIGLFFIVRDCILAA